MKVGGPKKGRFGKKAVRAQRFLFTFWPFSCESLFLSLFAPKIDEH
jgi:hypothetical protein